MVEMVSTADLLRRSRLQLSVASLGAVIAARGIHEVGRVAERNRTSWGRRRHSGLGRGCCRCSDQVLILQFSYRGTGRWGRRHMLNPTGSTDLACAQ